MRLLLAVTLLCGLALANVVLAAGLLGTDIDETTLAETLNAMIEKSKDALKPEMQDFLERVTAESGVQGIDLQEAAGSIKNKGNDEVYPDLQTEYGLPPLEPNELKEVALDLAVLAERWRKERSKHPDVKTGDISTAKVLYCLVYATRGANRARLLANRYLDRIHLVRMGGKFGRSHLMPLALAHAARQANPTSINSPLFYDAIHPAANVALDQLAKELGHADFKPQDLLGPKSDPAVRQQMLNLFVEAYNKHVDKTENREPINLPIVLVKHWLAASYKLAMAREIHMPNYGDRIVRAIKEEEKKAKKALRAQIGPSLQHRPAPLPPSQASTAAVSHRARTGYPTASSSPVSGGRTSLPDATPLARAYSNHGKAKSAAHAPYASFTTPVPPNPIHAGPYEAAYRAPPYVHSHYGLQPTAPVPPTADPMNLDLSLGPPSGHARHAPPGSDAVNLELSLSTGPSSGRSQTAERGKRPMHSEQVYPAAAQYDGFHHDPQGWVQYPPWGSGGQRGYGDQYGADEQDHYRRFEGWK